MDCPRPRLPGSRRVCIAARAQRERSASAARQRTSTPTPKSRRARSHRRRSRSSRDAGTPMARARRARAGTPRAASPRGVLVGGAVMGDDGDLGQTQQEGRDQAGGREGGQSTRGPVARRGAMPHRTPAQRRVRQATRPAGLMAIPSANDPTRASATRASERTYMAMGFSLACATRRASLFRRTQLCRDALARFSRRPPPRAQPATPDTTREPPPPAPVPACVAACARAYAQCGVRDGKARRLCPPSWPVRESRAHGAPRGRKRGAQQLTPHYPACMYAGLPLPHERTPEETKPDSRDVARLACAAPPRVTQRTHLEGREGRAPSLHYHEDHKQIANMPTSTQQVVRHSFRFPGPFAH